MAKWIQKAIKKPGALRKTLGVSKRTGNITAKNLNKAVKQRTKAGGMTKTARRARLALTLRGFKK
jgi:hypothetical protein